MATPEVGLTFPAAVRRFWPDVRPYRLRLLAALLFAAIAPALETLSISLYGRLIDDVLTPRDPAMLPSIAGTYVALTVAGGALGFGRSYFAAWVSEHVLYAIRLRLFTQLQRLPSLQVDQHRLGDLLTRLTEDVEDVSDTVSVGLADAITDALKVVFYTAALFVIDARLAVIAFVVAPPCWLLARTVARRLRMVAREQRAREATIASFIEEHLANAFLVHTSNRQDATAAAFATETAAARATQLRLDRMRALYAPLIELIEVGGILAVIWAGVYSLMAGQITLGGLLVFLAYLSSLYAPLRGLTHAWHDVATALASAERIVSVLDQRPDVLDPPHPRPLHTVAGDLQFTNVSFRYPGREEEALKNLSLRVRPGDSVAIVGASGAGKSTIARLLLRLADPDTGIIALDGTDVRQVAQRRLREAITLLPQESFFFSGSVADAIAYARPEATRDEVIRAARTAGAADFIDALPGGYDFQIGGRGRNLSGGQRQRIAIARAILHDAPVLILDEPTTGLDVAQASDVLAGIRRLMPGRTTIIISHDRDLVMQADSVLVLDGGQIVEQGAPPALAGAGGAFARLFPVETASSLPVRAGVR